MTIANKEKTPIKIMPPRRTIISKMMEPLNKVVERLIPSALIFAIGLTVAVLLMALWLTPSSPSEVLQEWGTGLSGLLEFMTQMALMLFLGFMLAHTKPFSRLLTWLARVPNTPMQAYLFVFLLAAMASLVTWGLGLVVGGLMARKVGEEAKRRSIQAHFPMLVASGFSGFIVQHMGYTGVGPLTAATPGSFLAEHLGQPLSTSETIYSSWNLVAILIVIAVVAATLYAIAPRGVKVIPFSGEIVEETTKAQESEKTPAERLDSSRIFTLVLGVILMLYVIQYFATGGELILDIVNWTFLALVFLLVRSPVEVIQLARSAATNVGEILLQFPLYAGILGVMSGTGLMAVISGWFYSIRVTRDASNRRIPVSWPRKHGCPLGRWTVCRTGASHARRRCSIRCRPRYCHHGRCLRRPVDEYDSAILGLTLASNRRPSNPRHPRVYNGRARDLWHCISRHIVCRRHFHYLNISITIV